MLPLVENDGVPWSPSQANSNDAQAVEPNAVEVFIVEHLSQMFASKLLALASGKQLRQLFYTHTPQIAVEKCATALVESLLSSIGLSRFPE